MSNSKSNRPGDREVHAVGRRAVDHVPGVGVHALHAQRHLERQRMAGAAEIAVGRDDGERRDALEPLAQEAQPFGAIAVIIGEQDLHGPVSLPGRVRRDRAALYCKRAVAAHGRRLPPSRTRIARCFAPPCATRNRSSSRSGRPSASAAARAPLRAARTRPASSPTARLRRPRSRRRVRRRARLPPRRDLRRRPAPAAPRRIFHPRRDRPARHDAGRGTGGARRLPRRGRRSTASAACGSSTARDSAPAIAGRC